VQVILSDPLLSFCFFAAVILLFVSLGVGFLRRDFKILFSRIGLIHLALALGAAALLLAFRHALLGLPLQQPPTWFPDPLQSFLIERMSVIFPETNSLASADAALNANAELVKTWPLAGISRLPLYIFALAYGPTAGLVAGLLFAPLSSLGLVVYPEVLLGLELCILGWLAIVPSSYQSRWAGSFNALLAYVLTFFSAGFAYLLWRDLPLNLDSFWRYLHPTLGGVLLSVLLLFLFGPKFFKRSFKTSGIIYETIEAGLEDIVVDKPVTGTSTNSGTDAGVMSVVNTSDSVESSLSNFSPSVSTTLNIVSQSENIENTESTQTSTGADSEPTSASKQNRSKNHSKKRRRSRKTVKETKQKQNADLAKQNQDETSDIANATNAAAEEQAMDTSVDTNIFLTNADDLLRVTGIDGSVYSELLNDLPDHLSEETLWLINFLLTEAKASSINTVYKSFKGSFGPSKKRFKRGVKEAHAEGWLTLMRDIEKDEVFVGLGRKLLQQS